ncbi:MAG: hypothetical protein RLZZ262_2543 [Bacteroidota bacterium]|jgi:hypothetical protein
MKNEDILVQFDDSILDCIQSMCDSLNVHHQVFASIELNEIQDIIAAFRDILSNSLNPYSTRECIEKYIAEIFSNLEVTREYQSADNHFVLSRLHRKTQSEFIRQLNVKVGELTNLTYRPLLLVSTLTGTVVFIALFLYVGWQIAVLWCLIFIPFFNAQKRKKAFKRNVTMKELVDFLFVFHYSKFRADNSVYLKEIEELVYRNFEMSLGIDRKDLNNNTRLFDTSVISEK